ncbi:hypothetical protein [Ferrimonas balearica]|uniref:hypothetical protein n=1 Tax=Ferrimonas balearica TaxID=44012 RepID=UPI001F22C684|nr:hypothetical protein [Ferrimonas balearica]MBY6093862.1 hypothetical protein [Ferrimonas balearica]
MGKGSDPKIKDTAAQKALADVSRQQWQMYQRDFIPVENRWMDRVGELNDDRYHQKIADGANVAAQTAFNPAMQQAVNAQAARGIKPGSGRFQALGNNGYTEMAKTISDTVNSGQVAQQQKYFDSIGNIAAIGLGQQTKSTQGFGDIASQQSQYAQNAARNSMSNRLGKQQAIGAGAGIMGEAYYNHNANQSEEQGG